MSECLQFKSTLSIACVAQALFMTYVIKKLYNFRTLFDILAYYTYFHINIYNIIYKYITLNIIFQIYLFCKKNLI